jgi:hypothetical protein
MRTNAPSPLHPALPALRLAAALALAAALPTAVAANPLTGWTALGDVAVVGDTLVLTTAFLDGDPAGDQPFNLSGTSAADIGDLEAAAGVPVFGLDIDEVEFGTEGSLVTRSFSVAAGDTLSFDWRFSTVEDLFEDHAFFVLDGSVTTLATRSAPGGASWQPFTLQFATAGSVALALGVIDTGDFLGVSTLEITNVQLTPIPEPSTWVLSLLGVAALAGWMRRRD